MGRGGAYVPARVPHRSIPVHNTCISGMETPLRGRSGGHTGAAPYAFCLRELRADVRPYGFVWADYVWAIDFVLWMMRGWLVSLG